MKAPLDGDLRISVATALGRELSRMVSASPPPHNFDAMALADAALAALPAPPGDTPEICGVVVDHGGVPIACGWPPGHLPEKPHSWSALPTVTTDDEDGITLHDYLEMTGQEIVFRNKRGPDGLEVPRD